MMPPNSPNSLAEQQAALQSKKARTRKQRLAAQALQVLSLKTFLTSLGVHVVLVALAIFVFVKTMKPAPPPPPVMEAPKQVQMAAKAREQKMLSAKHEAMAPKPSYSQKITANTPSKITLPEMPDINLNQMLPLDPTALVSDQVSSLVGAAGRGFGTGAGVGGSGGTGKGGMSFFNIKDGGRSVVVMLDVSDSMFGRTGDYDYSSRKLVKIGRDQHFQIIRDQAIELVQGLSPDSRFGIIRWSGSARSWRPELVRATDTNKKDAEYHIQEEVDVRTSGPTGGRPGGTRHDYAVEELLKLRPETAFLLTDGNATRSNSGKLEVIPTEEIVALLDAAPPPLPRIHTIYYMTGEDKKEEEELLKGIARKTGGKFSKIKAKGAKK
jgi:hypothetical protein